MKGENTFDKMHALARRQFKGRFQKEAELVSLAPGRINLIGDHTDYNNGLAMPAAINRWICTALSSRDDRMVIFRSENYKEELVFSLDDLPQARKHWEKYVLGLLSIFHPKPKLSGGFDALITGNVPLGAGLSSSAALEVSILNALRSFYGTAQSDLQLCKWSQQVENEELNLKSGLLDQWASQFSRKGHALFIDFLQGQIEPFPLAEGDFTWIAVNTGVSRELAGSRYMDRVEETALGLEELKIRFPGTLHLRDISLEQLEIIQTDSAWKGRVRHFITENERVFSFRKALEEGDFKWAGKLLVASHDSLRDDYQVSCPELDYLADAALGITGCLGSRMMGGGFGGCTLNLVQKECSDSFCTRISEKYAMKFGIEPEVIQVELEEGVRVVRL